MTTPPLPPEIKSAEEFSYEMARFADDGFNQICAEESIAKRDIAIWNAAIEKAASVWDKYNINEYSSAGQMKQAILNLKQKE